MTMCQLQLKSFKGIRSWVRLGSNTRDVSQQSINITSVGPRGENITIITSGAPETI